LALLSASAFSTPILTEEFVSALNGRDGMTWTAGLNEGSAVFGATREQLKGMMGVKKGGVKLPQKQFGDVAAMLPTQFNSIIQWPFCPSIAHIRDQSACGSCWAFGAVEAMSDRYCIHLKKNLSLSAAAMAFCCDDCGDGCNGGYPDAAWQYWADNGLVEEGCWPYPFPSCDHHIPGSKNPCPAQEYPSADCANQCSKGWSGPSWNQDLHKGASAYSLQGESDIMAEIYKNGPVETAYTVYEDFLSYKTGVYRHVSGSELGGHAVKFVGWGVENNVKFWLVANSWNAHWGDKGFFKILRGTDECGIEDAVSAGLPKN